MKATLLLATNSIRVVKTNQTLNIFDLIFIIFILLFFIKITLIDYSDNKEKKRSIFARMNYYCEKCRPLKKYIGNYYDAKKSKFLCKKCYKEFYPSMIKRLMIICKIL